MLESIKGIKNIPYFGKISILVNVMSFDLGDIERRSSDESCQYLDLLELGKSGSAETSR